MTLDLPEGATFPSDAATLSFISACADAAGLWLRTARNPAKEVLWTLGSNGWVESCCVRFSNVDLESNLREPAK